MDASTCELNKESFKPIDNKHTLIPPSRLGIEGPLRPDISFSASTYQETQEKHQNPWMGWPRPAFPVQQTSCLAASANYQAHVS